ncbi:hypothetical protein NFI96_007550, partial [Prochilodus magdalenae]
MTTVVAVVSVRTATGPPQSRTLHTGRCPQNAVQSTLSTGHCPQDAAHRTLPTGRCPQDTAHRTLPTGHCPQDAAHRTLPTGHCPQDAAHRTLPTGRCPQDAVGWIVQEEDQEGDMHVSPFLYTYCVKTWFSAEENLNPEFIRTVMFLIVELFLGPPAVVWALHVLHHHRKSGGRISAISVFLLFSDLLEPILSSATIVFTLGGDYAITCNVIAGLVFGTRVCGHHLHQLVALESVLSLRYPSVAHIFSPLCSTVLCLVVVVLVTVLMVLGDVGWLMNVRLSLWPLAVLVVTSLFTCKAFSGPVLSSSNRNPRVMVLGVAVVTMFVFPYRKRITQNYKTKVEEQLSCSELQFQGSALKREHAWIFFHIPKYPQSHSVRNSAGVIPRVTRVGQQRSLHSKQAKETGGAAEA